MCGNDIVYDRVEKYGIECDLKGGFLETALKPRQLPDLEEYAAERARHDFPYKYEIWDKEKTRAKSVVKTFYVIEHVGSGFISGTIFLSLDSLPF